MPARSDTIRQMLSQGPMKSRQLIDMMGVSQPTMSRALRNIGDDIVRIGAGPSIQYALRDTYRGFRSAPIYRITDEGRIRPLGELIPVRPEGFVMVPADNVSLHSDGLPWWLFDMRPQGYLGRATHQRMRLILACRRTQSNGQTRMWLRRCLLMVMMLSATYW